MPETPLYDALRALAETAPLRMHMPGHKGKEMLPPEICACFPLDFTELPPTGNLFEGGGPIGAAQALWADRFGMDACLFLTGGSTQGILTALTLACAPGEELLMDRGCHRSAYNALALLDLSPVYVNRVPLPGDDIAGPISPSSVERLLRAHPNIKALCITSPTYYGVLSDLPALAQVMHRHGGVLVVDAAHGAHLPFLGNGTLAAADLAVVSAHKTLPAPGQSALLLSSASFTGAQLRRAASLYGSSSPSYPMMAALDCCRAFLEGEGTALYRAAAAGVADLRQRFSALTCAPAGLDPCRLVIRSGDGLALEAALQGMGIYPEMADAGHVVLICTCADGAADFAKLERALSGLLPRWAPTAAPAGPPPPPEIVLSPRAARFSPCDRLPLSRAQGRISAGQAALYPPGVPVLAPGERITKKTIAYLYEIGYNMEQDIEVVPNSVCV